MYKVKVATRLCRNRKTQAVSDKERERERESARLEQKRAVNFLQLKKITGSTNTVNCVFCSFIHSLYVYIH